MQKAFSFVRRKRGTLCIPAALVMGLLLTSIAQHYQRLPLDAFLYSAVLPLLSDWLLFI